MEKWRPVVGWEGLYEISTHGRVRSRDRIVNSRWGKTRVTPGVYMSFYTDTDGYPCVTLSVTENGARRRKNRKVSRLVAEAFLAPPAPARKPNVLHWDDNKWNNHVSNLRWGTARENTQDMKRNGNHPKLRMTHCGNGHEYTEENTIHSLRGRRCRSCEREYKRRSRIRERERNEGR